MSTRREPGHEQVFDSGIQLALTGAVALITIDRADTRNAISTEVMHDLAAILDEIEARTDVAVVGIRGAGDRAFVSGGDLKELAGIRSFEAAKTMADMMRQVLDRLASLPMPTVALVNGDTYGGGAELAIACDMRLAATDVTIGFTQARLGIMPAWGGVERLTALVGRGRASYLLATGAALTAADAREMGLFEVVHPRDEFEEQARRLLETIAGVPAGPRHAIKQLVNAVARPSWPATADAATSSFAHAWIADEHWAMAAAAEHKRRARDSSE